MSNFKELDEVIANIGITQSTGKLKTPEQMGINSADISAKTSVEERQNPGLIERASEASQQARQEGIDIMEEGTEQRILGDTKREKATGFLKEVQGTVKGTAGSANAGLAGAAQPAIEGIMKGGEAVGEGFKAGLSAIVPDFIENPLKAKAVEAIQSATVGGKFLWEKLEPETKELIGQSGLTAIQLMDLIPFIEAPALGRAVATVTEAVAKTVPKATIAIEGITTQVKSLFDGAVNTVDDVVKQADESIKAVSAEDIRAGAEATAPELSITEEWAGVRPDIKKQIVGKHEKLKEYFDIAHARNLDMNVPTISEWGHHNVVKARDSLKSTLDDTGSGIGQFRQKIATTKVPNDDAIFIENTFDETLGSLNLTVKKGEVVKQKGKISGKISDSEINLLQSLRDDIQTFKQSPNVENLIDLRNSFDKRINFAKTQQQATNVVDPLSKKVRFEIKKVNQKIVGKENAQLLDDYSDMIGVLQDMNKAVNSSSGGEYLLKRFLSARGRYSREMFIKIKKYTGIDLMDDAVMSQIATEIIGNKAQKDLLQQSITNATLGAMDILAIAKGKVPVGIGATLLEQTKKFVAPVEETFLKATQK